MMDISLPALDGVTLLLATALITLALGLITSVMARLTPGLGLEDSSAAMYFGCAAFLLFALRGHVPMALSFVLANLLVLCCGACCMQAYARLMGAAMPWRRVAALTALGFSGVLCVHFLGAPYALAVLTLSITFGFEYGYVVLMLRRSPIPFSRPLRLLGMVSMGGLALISVVRVVLATRDLLMGVQGPAALSPPQWAVALVALLLFVLSCTAVMALVGEHHRNEALNTLRRDSLTGLYTRTAFDAMQPAMTARAAQGGYAVVLFDIDHFKAINDRHGHASGDIVLAHAARLVGHSTRLSDLAVRYGGEEFCVLLWDCSASEAAQFAQRIVTEAERQQVRLGDGLQVGFTLSAGVADQPQEAATTDGPASACTINSTIHRADEALYQAKRSGRNQAVLHSMPGMMVQPA